MRQKITILAICISLLLNVAGLVITISFMKLRSSYHKILTEKQTIEQNFAAVKAAAIPVESANNERLSKRIFSSHVDGLDDYYALLPPRTSGRLDDILVVYLHGMGSNYMEPFLNPPADSIASAVEKRFDNACFLSCNYRKDVSWGRDEAMSDITQNIRELLQEYPIDKIVLMGTSMGGCTVLSYAVAAPPDIREKLRGIVTVEGAGDLNKLAKMTRYPAVKYAIEGSMGGPVDSGAPDYARKSFIPNAMNLPKGTRVAVVSASRDTIVPAQLQAEIYNSLQELGFPSVKIDVDAEHGVPPSAIYVQALEFVLGQK